MPSTSMNQECYRELYSVTDFTHSVESESSVLTNDTLHLKCCSLVRKVSGRLISRTGWEILRDPRLLQHQGSRQGGLGSQMELRLRIECAF